MTKDMYQKRKERQENKKNETHEEKKTNINWYPGHMAKTKRLIEEKLNLIDVVYELVDARIPYSSKIADIDKMIKNKPKILVMTKADLCDSLETKKWINYYEENGYKVVCLNLNNSNDYKVLINMTHSIMDKVQSDRIAKGLKKKEVKVLVVGIPNVGKSTLINKMAGKKVANVGNMPGVTKNLNWLKTNSDILLLDSPGILWPKFENNDVALNLASMSAIKNEVLPMDEVAIYILNTLNKYYPDKLISRYKLENYCKDYLDNYEVIGKNMGAVIKGGEVDYDRINNIIINDIKNEIIKGITFDRR